MSDLACELLFYRTKQLKVLFHCKMCLEHVPIIIINMEKFLSSDWLRLMQFLGNSVQKRVNSVQKRVNSMQRK